MDHGHLRASSLLAMACLGWGTLQGGNVPTRMGRCLASAPRVRGLSGVDQPLTPARLVRRTLAVYGPVRPPGQDDPAFSRHGGERLVKALDLEAPRSPEAAAEQPTEDPAPTDPGLRAHVRAVALAGNFDNWVRRALKACEREGGSRQACEALHHQLDDGGNLFRLFLDVEITANKAQMSLAPGAGDEAGLVAANDRLEAALDRWRTHVMPLMESLREERRAHAAAAPGWEKGRGARFPDEDPREPPIR